MLPATEAMAHTELILSDPADGAVLEDEPAEVVLSFSEELIPDTVNVSVADGTGFVVIVAVPTVDGADVSFPWPAALTGPDYTVNYRVVSQDGHPVSGSVSFTGPAPTVAPSPVAVASPAPAPESSVGAEPAPEESGGAPVALIGVWVGIVTVAIAIVVTGVRRRRKPGEAP
jgi:methionine-rich copper-binding protein CopC